MSRRVVVTGIGALSPNGDDISSIWSNVSKGISGISIIENLQIPEFIKVKFGGEIKKSSKFYEAFKEPDLRRNDLFILYGVYTARQAIIDAGIENLSEEEKEMVGVFLGSGIGGLANIEKASNLVTQNKKLNPFFIPSVLINLLPGQVSIENKFKGPINSISTACATGTHCIGESMKLIKEGIADIMICGGSEAALTNVGLAGFDGMTALSRNNEEFLSASRPWDASRDGFVMSDGAGVLVLEEYEHAKKRGAKIYCEVAGYGLSSDASHITTPDPEGRGAAKAISYAIKTAQINTDEVDYINAHGTSTPAGDEAELRAIESVLKDHARKTNISSTKSTTGHLLGGAGALEAAIVCKAMENSIVPPTMHLNNPSDYCKNWNLTPNKAQEKNIKIALSNSFGFGGFNACLCFKKI